MSTATPDEPIDRPRVEGRLRSALDRGPVLLLAPAGWGKTVALTAALRERTGPAAWHACGRRDTDAGRLVLGILRSVGRAVPGATDVLLEQLGAPGDAVDPPLVVETLLDELRGLLVEPLVLALDDAERLGDDAATVDVLETLLDADPAVLRLALVTRTRPAARTARREAAGALTLVGQEDLRFDHDETAALLARRAGEAPGEDAVLTALHRSDGWPLGLVLGPGSGTGGPGLDAFLAEEVLGDLDPAARAALLDASVGDRSAVARDGLLELAVRRGLTVGGVPGPDGGPRWHPLVREALQARWRAERPASARAAVLTDVATRLQREGRPAEAVDRWLEAERPEAALDAMLAAAPATLRAAPRTVHGWLAALPDDLAATADARWLAGRLAVAEGRMRDAAAHDVAALPALAGDRRDAALMGVVECAYFVGDLRIADPVADELSDPASLAERPVALLAAAWLGINRVAHGDLAGGVALAEAAFATSGGDLARQFEPLLRCFERLPGGGHASVRDALAAVEAEARPGGFPEWTASIRGFLETDVGHREAAVALAVRMEERAAREDGVRHWRTLGAVQHGWALARAGRPADAARVLAPLRDAGFDGWPRSWVAAGLAIVADATGDADAARAHAERTLVLSAGAPVFLRDLAVLDVVPVLARGGARDRAATVLAETLATVEQRLGPVHGAHHLARLRAQRAWLRQGRRDGASATVAGGDAAAGARDDLRAAVGGGADVLRADWELLAPLVHAALEGDGLDPAATVAAVDAAFPGGPEVLVLAGHPTPAVRAATVDVVARSGHPEAAGRLRALRDDDDPMVRERAIAVRPVVDLPPLRVRVLGAFEVRRGGWPVDERTWGRPTAARLVRFLLTRRGAVVATDVLLDALWPERPPAAAKAQLQVAVSRARHVLDASGTTPAESAVRYGPGGYRLVLRERDVVDAEAFRAAAHGALDAPAATRGAALEEAARRWTGDPLPEERYAGWADAWSEDLRGLQHRVLHALAAEQGAVGDESAVATTARGLLELDPADEAAHRLLARAYARTGRPGPALRQFLVCRRALVDGLGVEPSEETARLHAAVLAGRAV